MGVGFSFKRLAAARGLRVRTFKAVPLTPATGVLQWVEHTVTLHGYLVGPDGGGGAHARHAPPGAWSFRECQRRMMEAAPGELRRAYDEAGRAWSVCVGGGGEGWLGH